MTKRWWTMWACLAAACGGDGDGDGDGGRSDTTAATAATSGADASEGFDPTTTAGPKADLGVTVPGECTLACELRVACLGEAEADCLLACTDAYDANAATSAECVAAYETLLSCVAELDCAQATEYQMGVGDYPCATEELAVPAACGQAPEVSPTCTALCTTTAMCTGADEAGCQTLCEEALGTAQSLSAECLAAQTASFDCIGALPCEQYAQWELGEGDYPCRTEDELIATQCQGE